MFNIGPENQHTQPRTDPRFHLTPVVLGRGVRLIDDFGGHKVSLEQTPVLEAPGVTHLRYRVLK